MRWFQFDGQVCCLEDKRHDYEEENTKFIGSAGGALGIAVLFGVTDQDSGSEIATTYRDLTYRS